MSFITEKNINLVLNNDNFNEKLNEESKKLNYEYIFIDGERCTTLDDLFNVFSEKFNFPDYFGYNWPAFDECLNDLNWLPAEGYILLISNVNRILPNDKLDFETFIKILTNTVNEWVNGRDYDSFPTPPTPFYLFLQSDKENESLINDVLSKYKI